MRRRPFVPLVWSLAVPIALALGPVAGEVAAQRLELRQGRPVRGSLAKGDTVRYSVQLGDDWFLYGVVDQISVDVVVRLLGPDGKQRGRFDGPARGSERFSRQTTDAGVHVIEVIPFEAAAGDYQITLLRAEPLEPDPKQRTDQLMSPYAGADSPGAAVQVWRDGRTLYSKAYGMANLAYGIPFATDTRTNIGSTSKQFTAFAVLLQAERGQLSLDDGIRKHIPELPAFAEPITIRHLISHTSGLREFVNLILMSGRQIMHGDWIERSELIEVVQRQPALQNVPGAEWNYNNTAFGLAALIVERTSGQPFHLFMQENVFGPLGMTRTMVRPTPEHLVPGMSEGYAPGKDGYRQTGDLGASTGAGGIYSTVEDLQLWVENFARPRVGSRAIFDAMMTSFVLNNGKETGYGFGLSIDKHRGLQRVHHGGSDLAHRSQLVYYPEINAGITVQSNHAGFNTGVANELAAAFFRDAMQPENAEAKAAGTGFDPRTYKPEDFDQYAGRYQLDEAPTVILTFTREATKLYTQVSGQEKVELVPTSDSTFALTIAGATVVFHRRDGKVDGVTLNQGGEHHATRLKDAAPAPWAPTAEELARFSGRYFSEELETFYTLAVEDTALVLHRRRFEKATLTAEKQDTFSGGGLTLAFERDRNGQVIGLYGSNGRARDVRFERVRP